MTAALVDQDAVLTELVRSRRQALRALLPEGLDSFDVLDLGCGRGDFVEFLVAEGLAPARVLGVDRDPERIAAARERFPEGRFMVADLRDLVVEEASADLVILSQVLSQITEDLARRDLLARAAAALRPGGRILVHDMTFLRPRSLRRGLRRVEPAALPGLLPEGLELSALERCTLFPPLLRLLAARAPGLVASLDRLPLLRGHWMGLLQGSSES